MTINVRFSIGPDFVIINYVLFLVWYSSRLIAKRERKRTRERERERESERERDHSVQGACCILFYSFIIEPRHKMSNNVVRPTSKGVYGSFWSYSLG